MNLNMRKAHNFEFFLSFKAHCASLQTRLHYIGHLRHIIQLQKCVRVYLTSCIKVSCGYCSVICAVFEKGQETVSVYSYKEKETNSCTKSTQ